MEIEKKYLVKKIPENLGQYEQWEIEQCYLAANPTIRIRKKNNSYILTYKNRHLDGEKVEDFCVAQEVELPLTKDCYEHLKTKADGKCIVKTRYRIPYGEFLIELDVFHGDYEGFVLAEVEFKTVEEGRNFTAPDWFDKDVSGDYHYSNSYLSSCR
jgi:CYTH domain-containing protein